MRSSASSNLPNNEGESRLPARPSSAAADKGDGTGWTVAVWGLRVIIGAVFLFSGFAKMDDLWGFIFKIEEYLAVWHLHQPRTLVIIAALLLSGYEFTLGALMIFGCYKRTAVWGLSLLMAVMLPLSLYLWIADPVADCGCFGEAVKLSNGATFLKNIAISAGLGLLWWKNARIHQALFNPEIQWLVGAVISLYIILVGLYGFNVQPYVDFRPFPVGTSLIDSDENRETYAFIYEKDGLQQEFTIDALPDSTWIFVSRKEVATDNRGGESLAIFSDGENVASDVIETEGYQIFVVIPEPRRAGIAYSYTLNEMYEYADSCGIAMAAILGTDEAGIERWQDVAMAEYQCFIGDESQLKELARGTIGIVLVEDGKIISKTSLSNILPQAIEWPESREQFIAALHGISFPSLKTLTEIFGAALLTIYFFQGIIIGLRSKIWRSLTKLSRRKEKPQAAEREQKNLSETDGEHKN